MASDCTGTLTLRCREREAEVWEEGVWVCVRCPHSDVEEEQGVDDVQRQAVAAPDVGVVRQGEQEGGEVAAQAGVGGKRNAPLGPRGRVHAWGERRACLFLFLFLFFFKVVI